MELADAIDPLFRAEIDRQLGAGEITASEADELRRVLLKPDRTTAAVPAVIVGAAIGCAKAVFVGEVVPQLKSLVKHGKIEEVSDIALGATIERIVGALPGGKWGKGLAQKALDKMGPKDQGHHQGRDHEVLPLGPRSSRGFDREDVHG